MVTHRVFWMVSFVVLAATACGSAGSRAGAPASTGSPAGPTGSAATQPAVEVPAPYRALFDNLSANLDAYQQAVDAMPATASAPGADPGLVGAAELLPANGNRLKALLDPATLPSVDAWLDKFVSMGIGGVTLAVKLPMLVPSFDGDAAAYTTFFATVVDHAHARQLTVDIELGELFCGTAYATCNYTYNGSYDAFVAASIAQAQTVIDQIHPDNLTILSEPTTEASLTGVDAFNTAAGAARYVHDVLAGLGSRGATKVGAGAATWLDPAYNAAILAEPVDYLALHIYPISASIAATIVADTALAAAAHKPIVADEVGLYKTDRTNVAGAATADSVYRLDSFSFFQPLDLRFLATTAAWARKAGVTYVSPFWATQFFAYLDWTPQLDALPFAALTGQSNAAAAKAFKADELTDLGRSWPSVLTR